MNTSDFGNKFRGSVQKIFTDFSDDGKVIDLFQTKKLIKQNNIKDSQLFLKKIQRALNTNQSIMNKDQFIKYFTKCDDKQHLQAVFDLIDNDKSQNISKQQLAAMNLKYGIGLTPNQIKAMINQISSDGQKVTKYQLIKFLTMNNN